MDFPSSPLDYTIPGVLHWPVLCSQMYTIDGLGNVHAPLIASLALHQVCARMCIHETI